jgi:hypothetical protein
MGARRMSKRGPTKPPPSPAEWADFQIPHWARAVFVQTQSLRANLQHYQFPPKLYHYTDVGGLLGIIQSHTLWATHVDHLNDSSEVQYARRLVIGMLAEMESEAADIPRAILARARETFDLVAATDVYVVCLCEQGDLLSQWRGYGKGGDGYAIGIDPPRLWAKFESAGAYYFGKIDYEPKRQREILAAVIGKLVDGVVPHVAVTPEEHRDAALDECSRLLRRVLWFALVTFKDPTFRSEEEWRVIQLLSHSESEERIRMRASGNRLVPYIELDFKQSEAAPAGRIPIVEVRHGPTLHPTAAKAGVSMLLQRNGYRDVKVEGSVIPLRV